MNFNTALVRNADTDIITECWMPEVLPSGWNDDEYDILTEISVDGSARVALSGLVRLTSEFMANAAKRTELGQDCGVFVCAWENNMTFPQTPFYRAGGLDLELETALPNSRLKPLNEPTLEPGSIAFTTHGKPPLNPFSKSFGYINDGPHFLVRATADGKDPLYLSKLGPSGPVVLTTFQQSLDFYPSKTAGVAAGFSTVPY